MQDGLRRPLVPNSCSWAGFTFHRPSLVYAAVQCSNASERTRCPYGTACALVSLRRSLPPVQFFELWSGCSAEGTRKAQARCSGLTRENGMTAAQKPRSYLALLAGIVAGCFSPDDPQMQSIEAGTQDSDTLGGPATSAEATSIAAPETSHGSSADASDEPVADVSEGTSGANSAGVAEDSGDVLLEDSTSDATAGPVGDTEDTRGAESSCGDGLVQDWEVCDDGTNDGAYTGCMPGCLGLAPYCGDDHVDAEFRESCDGDDGCNENCRLSGEVLADVLLDAEPRAVVTHQDGRIVLGGFTGAQFDSVGDARALVQVWETTDAEGFVQRSQVLFASAPRTGSSVTDGSVIRAAVALPSGDTLVVGQRRNVDGDFDWVASVDTDGELAWETYGLFTEHGSARSVAVARISDETFAVLGRRVAAGSNEAFIAAQRVGASRPVWTQQVIPDGIPYPETIGGVTADAGFFGVGSLYYGGTSEASFYRFDASAVIQESLLLRPTSEETSVFLFAVSSLEGDAVVAGAAATSSSGGILYPWIARVSPNGEVVWEYYDLDYPFSSTETSSGFRALTVDAAGGIIAVGGSPDPAGAQRPLVVNLDDAGEPVWRTEIPVMAEHPFCFYSASAVAFDERGDIIVATVADSSCLMENEVLEARGRLSKLAR